MSKSKIKTIHLTILLTIACLLVAIIATLHSFNKHTHLSVSFRPGGSTGQRDGDVQGRPGAEELDQLSKVVPWYGMVLAHQPKGYWSGTIRPSHDGRFDAFLSAKNGTGNIIVRDHQTETEMVVPAPNEQILEGRSIQHIAWDDAHTLYVVEHATTGIRTLAAWQSLPGDKLMNEISKIYDILYAWTPGDARVTMVGRVDRMVLALASGDGRVQLLDQPKEEEGGYLNIHEYRNNKLFSSRKVQITMNGKPTGYDWPELLPRHNELWFISSGLPNEKPELMFLAMLDLNAPGSEARLVAKDVARFIWSQDEQRLLIKRQKTEERNSLYLMGRGAQNGSPIAIDTDLKVSTSDFAGISFDGRSVYFQGLGADAKGITSPAILRDYIRIYKYILPG